MSPIRYCSKCHFMHITQQPLCPTCSHQLITLEEYSNAKKQETQGNLTWAIILCVSGVLLFIWSCLSPDMTFRRRISGNEYSPGAIGAIAAGFGLIWLICIGISRYLKHSPNASDEWYVCDGQSADQASQSATTSSSPSTKPVGMMDDQERDHCRVCGLKQHTPPWSKDGQPSFDICVCCGTEFGCDDVKAIDIHHRRKAWIASGTVWRDPSCRPKDWSLMQQLSNIPSTYRFDNL